MPENMQNPRHLVRTIEANGKPSTRQPLRSNTLLLGISIEKEALRIKLEQRVEAMVAAGLVDEVRNAAARYGWSAPALQAPAYKAFRPYIEQECTLAEAQAKFVQNDWLLAKRQRTWFKRNKDIHWICKTEEAVDLVTTFLNK
jgi:tRNA dimethylallyltransferase